MKKLRSIAFLLMLVLVITPLLSACAVFAPENGKTESEHASSGADGSSDSETTPDSVGTDGDGNDETESSFASEENRPIASKPTGGDPEENESAPEESEPELEESESAPTESEPELEESASAPEESEHESEESDSDPEESEPETDTEGIDPSEAVSFRFDTMGMPEGECAIVGISFSSAAYKLSEPWTLEFPSHAPTGEHVTKIDYLSNVFIPVLILGTEFDEKVLQPLAAKRDAGELDDFDYDRFENAWNRTDVNEMRLMARLAYLQRYPFLDALKVAKTDENGNVVVDQRGDVVYVYPVFYEFLTDNANAADCVFYNRMLCDVGYTIVKFYEGWDATGYGCPCENSEYLSPYPDAVRSVSIPETVSTVGARTFRASGFLRISNGVAYADGWAVDFDRAPEAVTFEEGTVGICSDSMGVIFSAVNPALQAVNLPNGLRYIGKSAFQKCKITDLVIPESVTVIDDNAFLECASLAGVAVASNSQLTSIGNCAFKNGTSLMRVSIPEKVTGIGDEAFFGCASLESVTFAPNSQLTRIGYSAFQGCAALVDAAIPENVTSIERTTFAECQNLVNVTLGDCLTSLEYGAFYGCTSLVSITIPENVTNIGAFAFSECKALTGIVIPASVTSFGVSVLQACDSLVSIVVEEANSVYHSAGNCLIETGSGELIAGCQSSIIPSDGTVTCIGEYAFSNCTALADITLPEGVADIGFSAFESCTGLTSVTLSEGLTVIGPWAFFGCTGLLDITIPETVLSIASNAFHSCTGLTGIAIPANVFYIDRNAFFGCARLESITVDADNSVYHSAGNCLIETESKTLMLGCKNSVIPADGSVTVIGASAFSDCTELVSVVIPAGVTTVERSAFRDCTSLTEVTISEGVTGIADYAFSGCTSLTEVTIPYSVTSIGAFAFSGCTSLSNVTFKETEGWLAGMGSILATDLADTGTAAEYLTETHKWREWTRLTA